MAQTAYPKIDELRVRLKADPKSRLFFPLAEELRKAGQVDEAEKVLRNGLANHPTYLSAWVSLGRVLRDLGRYQDAVDPLAKALQLDPGNVVVARLMAENYYSLGEKVEAIKKYKLVHALLPSDDDARAMIERLDLEIHPPAISSVQLSGEVPEMEESPFELTGDAPPNLEMQSEEMPAEEGSLPPMEDSPFDRTMPPFADMSNAWDDRKELFEEQGEQGAGDLQPMHYAHEESPFEEPVEGASIASVEIEAPDGIHIITAPPHANVAETIEAPLPAGSSALFERVAPEVQFLDQPVPDESDVFGLDDETLVQAPEAAEVEEPMAAPSPEDMTNTLTMAELYVRQGLVDDARRVYENILTREPENEEVRARLSILAAPSVEEPSSGDTAARRKIVRLERWLQKVRSKGAGSV